MCLPKQYLKYDFIKFIDLKILDFFNLFVDFVSQLYPHNPGAVHSKLDAMFAFLENKEWKDDDKNHLILIFYAVAQQHPEVCRHIKLFFFTIQ